VAPSAAPANGIKKSRPINVPQKAPVAALPRRMEQLVELDRAIRLFHRDDGVPQLDQVFLLHVEQLFADLFRGGFRRMR
jgi:hypothetical protein